MNLENEQIIKNITLINQINHHIKSVIGYDIIENINNDKILTILDNFNITIEYNIKRIEKNNLILLIQFRINNLKSKEITHLKTIIEFTIYLIKNDILLEYLKSFKVNKIQKVIEKLLSDLKDIVMIFKIENYIDYEYIMSYNYGIFNETAIKLADNYRENHLYKDLNDDFVSIDKNWVDKYESKSNMLKEHVLQLYLNEIPLNNERNPSIYSTIEFDIFEIINLLYYDLFDFYVPSKLFDSSYKYSYSLLFHKKKALDDTYIATPFIANRKFENKFIRMGMQKNLNDYYDIRTVFNGRFFFKMNDSNAISLLTEASETSGELELYKKGFIKKINDANEFITKNTVMDSHLEAILELINDYIGIRISKFAIGEIIMQKVGNGLDLSIDLNIRNPDFSLLGSNYLEGINQYSLSLFHGNLPVKHIFKTNILRFIEGLNLYLRRIFNTYPLHPKIIGNSDILYYFKLYDHFPTLRSLNLPLVENIDYLLNKDFKLLSSYIMKYEDEVTTAYEENIMKEIYNNPIIHEQFDENNNPLSLAINEIKELKEYLDVMKDFHHKIGMDFGEFDQDLNFKKIGTTKIISRMPKYYTKDFKIEPIILSNYSIKINEMIRWCSNHEYYFEINYIIENLLKLSVKSYSSIDYSEYIKLQSNLEMMMQFSKGVENFKILYPIQEFDIPSEFLLGKTQIIETTRIILLLISEKVNHSTIVIKLNETIFTNDEIRYLEDNLKIKIEKLNQDIDIFNMGEYPKKVTKYGIKIPIDIVKLSNMLDFKTINNLSWQYEKLFNYEHLEYVSSSQFLDKKLRERYNKLEI